MRILLAVDGSPCSDAAVEEVARRPWPDGTEVRVLSAYEPAAILAMAEAWAPPEGYYEQMERADRERAGAAAEKAAARLRSACADRLSVSAETVRGLPKEAIVAEAERWGADLIVVGSHGYRGWKRLWLGSVSHAVATHAPCSVEIVRSRSGASNEDDVPRGEKR
jgi:nucleotide-binding universal stress UspA family protein